MVGFSFKHQAAAKFCILIDIERGAVSEIFSTVRRTFVAFTRWQSEPAKVAGSLRVTHAISVRPEGYGMLRMPASFHSDCD